MNPRILKKLSKRAVPYMIKWGLGDITFPAPATEEIYGDHYIKDRRHMSRSNALRPTKFEGYTSIPSRTNKQYPWITLNRSCPVLKGTPILGWVSGYYEPEYQVQTAWDRLKEVVWNELFTYDPVTDVMSSRERPKSVADFLRIADRVGLYNEHSTHKGRQDVFVLLDH